MILLDCSEISDIIGGVMLFVPKKKFLIIFSMPVKKRQGRKRIINNRLRESERRKAILSEKISVIADMMRNRIKKMKTPIRTNIVRLEKSFLAKAFAES